MYLFPGLIYPKLRIFCCAKRSPPRIIKRISNERNLTQKPGCVEVFFKPYRLNPSKDVTTNAIFSL